VTGAVTITIAGTAVAKGRPRMTRRANFGGVACG
jgi:hypothetical protein